MLRATTEDELRPVEQIVDELLVIHDFQAAVSVRSGVKARREKIMRLITQDGEIPSTRTLASLFRVSTKTITRDLEYLSRTLYIRSYQGFVPSLPPTQQASSAELIRVIYTEHITQIMARTLYPCATQGTPGCLSTTYGRYPLCNNCYRYYGKRDEWEEEIARWLAPLIAYTNRERIADARFQFFNQYGIEEGGIITNDLYIGEHLEL